MKQSVLDSQLLCKKNIQFYRNICKSAEVEKLKKLRNSNHKNKRFIEYPAPHTQSLCKSVLIISTKFDRFLWLEVPLFATFKRKLLKNSRDFILKNFPNNFHKTSGSFSLL